MKTEAEVLNYWVEEQIDYYLSTALEDWKKEENKEDD